MININLDKVSGEYCKLFITNHIQLVLKNKISRDYYKIVGQFRKHQFIEGLSYYISNKLRKKFDYKIINSEFIDYLDFMIPILSEDKIVKILYSDLVPKNGYGLYVLSREKHSNLKVMFSQIQNEHTIEDFKLPEGWFVISI